MTRYIVHIVETRVYRLAVEADDEDAAVVIATRDLDNADNPMSLDSYVDHCVDDGGTYVADVEQVEE